MRPRARALLPLALALALPLAAALAAAHALPVSSSPASGAVLKLPPREAVVVFSEAADPAFTRLEVLDANGTAVGGPHALDGDRVTLRAPLPADLPYGPYTVSWKALSAVDGHSTRGVIAFLYPDPSKPLSLGDLPPAQATQETLVGPQDMVLRGVMFVGLFAVLGACTTLLLVVRRDAPAAPWPPESRLGVAAGLGGLAAAVATLLLAASGGAAAADVGVLQALARPGIAFAGQFGQMAAVRAPLLLAAGLACWAGARWGAATPRGRGAWAAGAVLACLAAVTVSLSSHAAALAAWTLPAIGLDALHLVASAAWVGGLGGLAWALWQARGAGPMPWGALAARFSALALGAVALVVLTGVAASLLQLREPLRFLESDYGRILALKVALVLGLVAFGARHRFVLVPAVQRSQDEAIVEASEAMGGARRASRFLGGDAADRARGAHARFGRSLRAEAALGVVVLLVAAVLSAASPPAPAAPPGPPAVLELTQVREGVNVTLLVSPNPPRAGLATLDVFLSRDGLALNDTTEGALTFLPPDRTLGSSTAPMEQPHPGHFAAEGPYFTMPGAWVVRVNVQRSGAYDVVVDFRVQVEG